MQSDEMIEGITGQESQSMGLRLNGSIQLEETLFLTDKMRK